MEKRWYTSKINEGLNRKERQRQGKEPRPSMLSMDSQSIKAGSFISQDKGINGNKRSMVESDMS